MTDQHLLIELAIASINFANKIIEKLNCMKNVKIIVK